MAFEICVLFSRAQNSHWTSGSLLVSEWGPLGASEIPSTMRVVPVPTIYVHRSSKCTGTVKGKGPKQRTKAKQGVYWFIKIAGFLRSKNTLVIIHTLMPVSLPLRCPVHHSLLVIIHSSSACPYKRGVSTCHPYSMYSTMMGQYAFWVF